MPESTFLNKDYQSNHYHNVRPTYPSSLVEAILSYHTGERDTVIDIGCGTGFASSLFAPSFKHAIGIDPSDSMLQTARSTNTQKNLSFVKSFGEDVDKVVSHEVDMVIGAESIHWCDLDILFEKINTVLRKDGTFAFWFYIQPEFIDLGKKASEIYWKYCYSEEYMGQYLTDFQRTFFSRFGGKALYYKLSNVFKDISFKSHCNYTINDEIKELQKITNEDLSFKSPFYIHTITTLTKLKDFARSWSIYTAYRQEHPNDEKDIVDVFINELKNACNITDMETPLNIEWTTFYYTCRKQ
ncbi:hypothetical protein KAFR_0B06440 [Kazachstania africana CBS 2517]|uniref:Methyltransferase type 11 domain-containing protein n=1 Tax=Kazachstania africana (strain ATCC 22294 / BCRC 22015 / CBS 2517 / CECT 1963 / NBRC 1671 / NRRL Y-8276) TaxID=1071382 RepID=H2ARE0_KAZAF|nr:hypothetical protein KAFR_0B06440 [Kazachstania africana CBS 2517]CCF56940.1 hypothetical protein KAFR_0B06440 [Kazachstania africana CBS 2517]